MIDASAGDFTVEATNEAGEHVSETFSMTDAPAASAPDADASVSPPAADDGALEAETAGESVKPRDEKGRFVGKPGEEPAPEEPAHDSAKPPSKKDRIAYLTWEREEAKRQAAREREERTAEIARERAERERLAQRLAQLEAQAVSASPSAPAAPVAVSAGADDDPAPKLEQFKDEEDPYLAYVDARADWKARQVIKAEREREAKAAAERSEHERMDAFVRRREAFAAKTPDFVEKVNSSHARFSEAMRVAIVGSEVGPEIVYWLASHQDDCERFYAETAHLGPAAAPLMQRVLESHVKSSAAPTAQPTTVRSAAKPPIRPVGSSPVGSLSASDDEDDPDPNNIVLTREYVQRRNAEERKRRAS